MHQNTDKGYLSIPFAIGKDQCKYEPNGIEEHSNEFIFDLFTLFLRWLLLITHSSNECEDIEEERVGQDEEKPGGDGRGVVQRFKNQPKLKKL